MQERADQQAIAVEGLTAEQLEEKRGRRSEVLSSLRMETEMGKFLVRMAQKALTVLQASEDALIGVGKMTVKAESRPAQQECVKRQVR